MKLLVPVVVTILSLMSPWASARKKTNAQFERASRWAYQMTYGMTAFPVVERAIQAAFLNRITCVEQGVQICQSVHGGTEDVYHNQCIDLMIYYINWLYEHPDGRD